jgi:hypothetical protein
VSTGHPDGDRIMQLTMRYLDARFGLHPLSTEDRRDFESKIRELKEQGPSKSPPEASATSPDDEPRRKLASNAGDSPAPHGDSGDSTPPDSGIESTRQSGEVLTHPPRDSDEELDDEGA